jgi:predicted nucleotidyltransferase
LQRLVEAARTSFTQDLVSMILFGSAAEGRLRPTSDLNLLLVLKKFERNQVDGFREPLRLAQVAARATAMFLLETELMAAAEAFAVKFDDIVRRHRVLYGANVLTNLTTPRAMRKLRLRQVLLNLSLRLRERYATTSLREEQLAIVAAEAAGPLRAAALTLCDLEGRAAGSPREALRKIAVSQGEARWTQMLDSLSEARKTGTLPAGAGPVVLFDLMQLTEAMRIRTEKLP